MKIKKLLKIGQMPKHLREAHIKLPVQRKAKKTDTLRETVDQLGREYDESNEQLKTLTANVTTCKEVIKDLASNLGTQHGKMILVQGDKYEVGYVLADQEPKIDYAKAKKYLPKHVRVNVEESIINPKKLEAVINGGHVPASILSKIIVPVPAQKRIHVKKKK